MAVVVPGGRVRKLLDQNNLGLAFNPQKMAQLMRLAASRLEEGAKHADALADAVEGGTGSQVGAEAMESLGDAYLALLMVPAMIGMDAGVFFAMVLQSETDQQQFHYEGMVKSALALVLGPAYHGRLGLVEPRRN